ncbi:hypothetical protein H2203_007864 [Taxawa tesnikishii (nom. ined.)]|nr:hypothetical protein H2203_007864 [Dothideales sp. JES 119]
MASKYTAALQGARLLVLGGTSGIGYCVAENALAHGATVIVSSSRTERIDAAVSKLKSDMPEAAERLDGLQCDLSDPATLKQKLESLLTAATKSGKLDHIVFTAGDAISTKPIAEQSIEALQKMGNIRFYGPLVLGGLAAQYMVPSFKSSITLTSGTMSQRPSKGFSAVAAWGSGIEGITRGLAVDLAPLRVNMISAGAVHTEMFDDIPKERLDRVLQSFKDASLVDRVGTPEQLSEAYLYCMRCTFATGSIVEVDGGRLRK